MTSSVAVYPLWAVLATSQKATVCSLLATADLEVKQSRVSIASIAIAIAVADSTRPKADTYHRTATTPNCYSTPPHLVPTPRPPPPTPPTHRLRTHPPAPQSPNVLPTTSLLAAPPPADSGSTGYVTACSVLEHERNPFDSSVPGITVQDSDSRDLSAPHPTGQAAEDTTKTGVPLVVLGSSLPAPDLAPSSAPNTAPITSSDASPSPNPITSSALDAAPAPAPAPSIPAPPTTTPQAPPPVPDTSSTSPLAPDLARFPAPPAPEPAHMDAIANGRPSTGPAADTDVNVKRHSSFATRNGMLVQKSCWPGESSMPAATRAVTGGGSEGLADARGLDGLDAPVGVEQGIGQGIAPTASEVNQAPTASEGINQAPPSESLNQAPTALGQGPPTASEGINQAPTILGQGPPPFGSDTAGRVVSGLTVDQRLAQAREQGSAPLQATPQAPAPAAQAPQQSVPATAQAPEAVQSLAPDYAPALPPATTTFAANGSQRGDVTGVNGPAGGVGHTQSDRTPATPALMMPGGIENDVSNAEAREVYVATHPTRSVASLPRESVTGMDRAPGSGSVTDLNQTAQAGQYHTQDQTNQTNQAGHGHSVLPVAAAALPAAAMYTMAPHSRETEPGHQAQPTLSNHQAQPALSDSAPLDASQGQAGVPPVQSQAQSFQPVHDAPAQSQSFQEQRAPNEHQAAHGHSALPAAAAAAAPAAAMYATAPRSREIQPDHQASQSALSVQSDQVTQPLSDRPAQPQSFQTDPPNEINQDAHRHSALPVAAAAVPAAAALYAAGTHHEREAQPTQPVAGGTAAGNFATAPTQPFPASERPGPRPPLRDAPSRSYVNEKPVIETTYERPLDDDPKLRRLSLLSTGSISSKKSKKRDLHVPRDGEAAAATGAPPVPPVPAAAAAGAGVAAGAAASSYRGSPRPDAERQSAFVEAPRSESRRSVRTPAGGAGGTAQRTRSVRDASVRNSTQDMPVVTLLVDPAEHEREQRERGVVTDVDDVNANAGANGAATANGHGPTYRDVGSPPDLPTSPHPRPHTSHGHAASRVSAATFGQETDKPRPASVAAVHHAEYDVSRGNSMRRLPPIGDAGEHDDHHLARDAGLAGVGAGVGVAVGQVLSHDRQNELQQGTRLVDSGPVQPGMGMSQSQGHLGQYMHHGQHQQGQPGRHSSFGYRPEPVYDQRPDSRYSGVDRRVSMLSRANTVGRNGTLSRAANGGTVGRRAGAFGRGAGMSVGTQPEEVLGRDDIHERAEVSERQLDPAALRRLSAMEKKDAHKLLKLLNAEAKEQARAVDSAIKDLRHLAKLQKESIATERKSQYRLAKWTSREHKARMRFLKEKERYEKVEGELRNAENDFEERRDHAAGLTAQVAERTQEIDDMRAQKAADDREREVKRFALKHPAHS